MAFINWDQLGKQLLDWGGDYDIFADISVKGGKRNPTNGAWVGPQAKPTTATSTSGNNSGQGSGGGATSVVNLGSSSKSTGGSSGRAVSQNLASGAQLAEYQQAIDQLQHTLGRLDPQLNIALDNLRSKFNQSSNELQSQLNRAQSQYDTK